MKEPPRLIRMNASDNVAVVANDGGLPAGTIAEGVKLVEPVPQAHKVALCPIGAGDPVLRYEAEIGRAWAASDTNCIGSGLIASK